MNFLFTASVILLWATSGQAQPPDYDHGLDIETTQPLITAHRGAAGVYPEHSLLALQGAVDQGTDFIECDLCLSKDLHLVCMHESWMSKTTNVADVFSEDRMNTYFVVDDARNITDYFSVDFTLAELKTIMHRQRYDYRDPTYDDQYPIMTVEELIAIVQSANRTVGLYLEIKDPNWVNSLDIVTEANTTYEQLIVDLVHSYGYVDKTDACIIQSFQWNSIEVIANLTDLPVVIVRGGAITDAELESYSKYAYGINADRNMVIRKGLDNKIREVTDLVERVHSFGMKIHLWTIKNEYMHLAYDYQQDPVLELATLLDTGADGIVTDFPGTMKRYLQSIYCDNCQ